MWPKLINFNSSPVAADAASKCTEIGAFAQSEALGRWMVTKSVHAVIVKDYMEMAGIQSTTDVPNK